MKDSQSVVANKWAKGNSLLVRLINKLRSLARVTTIASKMKAEKPDRPEADDPEENGSDTVEDGDPDLDSCGISEESGIEEV